MKTSLLLAVSMAGVSGVANAQTERELDSHAHGLATMNIAIADSNVFLELETPWDNLVGFEHKPSTEEQHAMVDSALESLRQASSVVVLNGGSCELHEVHIENSMGSDEHEEHEEHDDHADHEGEDTHSSLLVSYEYKCEDISSLSDIEVAAFSTWENFESISVQMIGPGGQSAVDLSPRNTFINLDSVK